MVIGDGVRLTEPEDIAMSERLGHAENALIYGRRVLLRKLLFRQYQVFPAYHIQQDAVHRMSKRLIFAVVRRKVSRAEKDALPVFILGISLLEIAVIFAIYKE